MIHIKLIDVDIMNGIALPYNNIQVIGWFLDSIELLNYQYRCT